jgi:hypothetical protein
MVAVALKKNATLKSLRISDNFLTRECGYTILEHLRHNERLLRIDVSATQIDHFAIQALRSLCKRNLQIEKEIGLQPMKKEVIQLSIQRTKMPEAESRLAALEAHRAALEDEVAALDETIEATQTNALENILLLRKQIQATHEGIADDGEEMVRIEGDREKMVRDFEERYAEIVGNSDKEKLAAKAADEQAVIADGQMQQSIEATAAEQAALQDQIEQIRALLAATRDARFGPELLREWEQPEIPDFMLVQKSNLFVEDEMLDLREQEERMKGKKKKKKAKKKPSRGNSPKGKKRKESPQPQEPEQPARLCQNH